MPAVNMSYSLFGPTLLDLYKQMADILAVDAPVEEASAQARILLLEYTGLKSYELPLHYSNLIEKECIERIKNAVNELCSGKPLQYILGHGEFYGIPLRLDKRALIPRPETEELVRWVLDDLQQSPKLNRPLRVLDIGTGTGAIALALSKNLPKAELMALDVSREALDLAEENAHLNKLNVTFVQQDILAFNDDYSGISAFNSRSFDIILSNPPYIPQSEAMHMQQNVLLHEPSLALFVPDNDPFVFYKAIAAFSKNFLVEQGLLYLEIHENYETESLRILESAGMAQLNTRQDLQGKPRMIRAENKLGR